MRVADDEAGMRAALREARESLARDEVPVGCSGGQLEAR